MAEVIPTGRTINRMVVDSLDLVYVAFLECRIYGRSDRTLDAALYALDRANLAGTVEVEIPDDMLAPNALEFLRLHDRPNANTRLQDMTPEQVRLFSLTREAAVSMKEACSIAEEPGLIKQIGYALHVLPEVARHGGWREDLFQFNFRRAAAYWSLLPAAMRDILCRLAGVSLEGAEVMVKKRGFALGRVRGRPGERTAWSQLEIIEPWSDPDAN